MKHLLHQIALRCSHFSTVHPCSTASQAATYFLRIYKFGHRPTQRPNVSINSSMHNQLKRVVEICNPLTPWKKNLYKLHAIFIFSCEICFSWVIYSILNLTTISNIESTSETHLFSMLWTSFAILANAKMPSITSCVASHDIIQIDSESSICCYHP